MRFLYIVLFAGILGAANIQHIDITPSEEQIEIAFRLDSVFNSRVIKQDSRDFSSVILKDTTYSGAKVAQSTRLISNIEIFQQNNDVYVILEGDNFDLKYALSVLHSENLLKILITPKVGITTSLLSQGKASDATDSLESALSAIRQSVNATNPSYAPTSLETWRYVAVVGILLGLLIALVVVKRRIAKRQKGAEFSYFGNTGGGKNSGIFVKKTINIDVKNKIIVLDSRDYEYVIFVGESGSFVIDRVAKQDFYAPQIPSESSQNGALPHLLRDYYDVK